MTRLVNLLYALMLGYVAYLCYDAFWFEIQRVGFFPIVLGALLLGIFCAVASVVSLLAAIIERENGC